MKLAIVGLGQCGGRIADEFLRVQMRTHGLRGLDIIVEALAADTDANALAQLATIRQDNRHRILLGTGQSHGRGTARSSSLGTRLMREEAARIFESLTNNPRHTEADAVLIVAAAAGGTGSGGAPVLARALKERFTDKPVCVLLVLPFEHEESEPNAISNTSNCLDNCGAVADAIIMCDNQRYMSKNSSIKTSLQGINQQIIEPFINLLCSGEGRSSNRNTVSTTDLIFALDSWTAVGYGRASLPPVDFQRDDFTLRDVRGEQAVHAMNEALASLSHACRPADAYKALYLVSGSGKELGLNIFETLDSYVQKTAPHAQRRGGGFPNNHSQLEVSVLLSNFGETQQMKRLREKARAISAEPESAALSKSDRLLDEFGKDIPDL